MEKALLKNKLSWTNTIVAGSFSKKLHRLKLKSISCSQASPVADCGVLADQYIFSDSSIASRMTFGKTKAKALCEKVLAPYSVQTDLDYVKEKNLPFSVATCINQSVSPSHWDIFTLRRSTCSTLTTNMFLYETQLHSLKSWGIVLAFLITTVLLFFSRTFLNIVISVEMFLHWQSSATLNN